MSETGTGIEILTGTRPRMAKVRVKTKSDDPFLQTKYSIKFEIESGTNFDQSGLNDIGRIRLDIDTNTILELTPDTSNFIEPEHPIDNFNHDVNLYFEYEHTTEDPSVVSAYNTLNDNIQSSINVYVIYNDLTDLNFSVEILDPNS
jgi:hypothetical protein